MNQTTYDTLREKLNIEDFPMNKDGLRPCYYETCGERFPAFLLSATRGSLYMGGYSCVVMDLDGHVSCRSEEVLTPRKEKTVLWLNVYENRYGHSVFCHDSDEKADRGAGSRADDRMTGKAIKLEI